MDWLATAFHIWVALAVGFGLGFIMAGIIHSGPRDDGP
jgi:hypothetical protein